MENLIENVLSQAITEIGEGTIRRGLEEVEATTEAEPGVIAQSGTKLAVGTDLTQVD